MKPTYPIAGVVYPSPTDVERYEKAGWYPRTAGAALRDIANRLPNKTALVDDRNRVTFAEFDAASEQLAAALLDLGLLPGDRAMYQMGSVAETAIALLACAKAGIVPVCTLPQHRSIEVGTLAKMSGAKAYFVQADFSQFDLVAFASEMAERCSIPHLIVARSKESVPKLALEQEKLISSYSLQAARSRLAGVKINPVDVLMFQLSGGTTNVPKVIPRFNGEFLGTSFASTQRNAMGADLVTLFALPLIHTAGLIGILYPCILLGGTCVLMQRMEVRTFFSLVERERVTHSVSIGPVASQMLEYDRIHDHDLSSLKLLTNFHGSEAMERHVGVTCVNVYGLGEGLIMGSEIHSPKDVRFETVGWPVNRLDEVRLLAIGTERDASPGELGELCFRGPSRTPGYFNQPEINRASFTSDGFFRTGDVLTVRDLDGRACYSFHGRLRDNINRGGEKFGAEEVETIIARHHDVADVKVVAMPERVFGERACAFLIMIPGAPELNVKTLGDFLIAEGLAKYKLPERVEIVASFPITQVGKVDKEALRVRIAEMLATEGNSSSR